jgi:hypothetical protein
MASPSPNPSAPSGALPRSKRSKIRARSSTGTPGPSSATEIVARGPPLRTATVTTLPAGA